MSTWNKINKEQHITTALVVLCQEYVRTDEEFSNNAKIKKNFKSCDFWIELAQELHGAIALYLQNQDIGFEAEGYDDCDSVITDNEVLNFVMDPTNRFELNDIICDTISGWIKHFGNKR